MLHAGLVHDLVVVHQRLLVLVDLRLDRGMGGLIAAHPAGCLEGVQQLLGVGPADGAAAQGLVDLHILQNQRIVGDLLALVVIVGLYVLQDVVGAAVVGVVVVMVVDQVAVLLRVVLDQAAEVGFPLLIHLLVLHAALDALGQVAAQLVGVAHLRPGHHIRVQRRDLVVVQHLIDVVQVLVGITRDRRAEVGIVCLFILQIVQHFGGVGRQHVHALVIVVAAVQQAAGGVHGQGQLHIFLRVDGGIAADDGIQHPAGVARTQAAVHHQRHLVFVREVGRLFPLVDESFLQGLLVVRDQLFHRAVGAHKVDAALQPKALHGLRDDLGRIDLVHVHGGAVRGKAILDAVVQVLDVHTGGVGLVVLAVPVHHHCARHGHGQHQCKEPPEVAQDIKLFQRCSSFRICRAVCTMHRPKHSTTKTAISTITRLRPICCTKEPAA